MDLFKLNLLRFSGNVNCEAIDDEDFECVNCNAINLFF